MSEWAQLLEALILERGRSLHGYAYVLTGSAADADDLVQNALVKVFSKHRRLTSVPAAEVYVRKTMRTVLIDDRRHHRHRREVHGLVVDAAGGTDPAATGAAATLHAALLNLPPRERLCVVMRFMDDLAFGAIASQLGIAEATARKYTHDGVRRLGTFADDFGITPDLADQDQSYSITVYAHEEA